MRYSPWTNHVSRTSMGWRMVYLRLSLRWCMSLDLTSRPGVHVVTNNVLSALLITTDLSVTWDRQKLRGLLHAILQVDVRLILLRSSSRQFVIQHTSYYWSACAIVTATLWSLWSSYSTISASGCIRRRCSRWWWRSRSRRGWIFWSLCSSVTTWPPNKAPSVCWNTRFCYRPHRLTFACWNKYPMFILRRWGTLKLSIRRSMLTANRWLYCQSYFSFMILWYAKSPGLLRKKTPTKCPTVLSRICTLLFAIHGHDISSRLHSLVLEFLWRFVFHTLHPTYAQRLVQDYLSSLHRSSAQV